MAIAAHESHINDDIYLFIVLLLLLYYYIYDIIMFALHDGDGGSQYV